MQASYINLNTISEAIPSYGNLTTPRRDIKTTSFCATVLYSSKFCRSLVFSRKFHLYATFGKTPPVSHKKTPQTFFRLCAFNEAALEVQSQLDDIRFQGSRRNTGFR